MPKFIIERAIPGAGTLPPEELHAISRKSCGVLQEMGLQIQWQQNKGVQNRATGSGRIAGIVELALVVGQVAGRGGMQGAQGFAIADQQRAGAVGHEQAIVRVQGERVGA